VQLWVGGKFEIRNPKSEILGGLAGVHSAAKETVMEEFSLTLGAHLLLWGFPLVLIIVVVVESLLDARKGETGR